MPPLSSLEPYLRPLQGLRVNPYQTLAGRQGSITAVGDPDGRLAASNTVVSNNDDGEAQRMGDTGPAAQLDRLYAAEAASKRSADLTNWLDKQAAERVPAMLERDDPEAAARMRALQVSALKPETPATPNLDALNALLEYESPLAGQARSRAMQEKIQNKVLEDAATRDAEANFFMSPIAQRQRAMAATEARTNARRTRNEELSALLDPRAIAAQATDTAGRLAVAQAQNPPDYRTLAFQNAAKGQPGATNAPAGQPAKIATWAEIESVANEKGVTVEEAAAYAKAQGYTIVD